MRIKMINTSEGFRMEGYEDNRRVRTPLVTQNFNDKPLQVGAVVMKARILAMMTLTGLEYAKRNSVQRYTTISEGD